MLFVTVRVLIIITQDKRELRAFKYPTCTLSKHILFSFDKLHRSGITSLRGRVQSIRELPGDLWFPEKSRLLVQADIIERATGNKERAVEKSCQFTSSPYLIKFKNTPKYFKPGLRYVVKVGTGITQPIADALTFY